MTGKKHAAPLRMTGKKPAAPLRMTGKKHAAPLTVTQKDAADCSDEKARFLLLRKSFKNTFTFPA